MSANPGQSDLRNAVQMAMDAYRAGQADQAAGIYNSILAQSPNHPAALRGLAMIVRDKGDALGAAQLAHRATQSAPNRVPPHITLARACRMMGWQEEAAAAYKRALELTPNDPGELHLALAQAQLDARQSAEALETYSTLAKLNPGDTTAHAGRALALQRLGRAEEALDLLRMALKVVSYQGIAASVALITAFVRIAPAGGAEDEAIKVVERLCLESRLPQPEMAEFALKGVAAIHERRGEIDKAWALIERANRETYKPWPADQHAQRITEKLQAYSPDRVCGLATTSFDTELPVFVVGMPRSGTTLIEQIIHAHPQAHGCGELSDIWWHTAHLQSVFDDRSFGPTFVDQLTPEALEISAQAYLQRLQSHAPDAKRLIDKLPGNYLNLGLIWQMFPRARVIHAVRDPLDTCFSVHALAFPGEFHYRRNQEALAEYFAQYRRLMEGWAHMFEGRLLEVRYEDLVHEQEDQSRKIIDFLGLAWDDTCLQFWQSGRTVLTASEGQVTQPMYTSSVGRAKRFEAHLAPLIAGLRP